MIRTDSLTIEREYQHLIAALILTTRPRIIVETGTYHAETTLAMLPHARAVGGTIHTYETDPDRHNTAKRMARRALGGSADIRFHNATLTERPPAHPPGLAVLDSCLSCRKTELAYLRGCTENCIILIHDANLRNAPAYVRQMNLPVIHVREGMGVIITQT